VRIKRTAMASPLASSPVTASSAAGSKITNLYKLLMV
jgi:hypothetical protein